MAVLKSTSPESYILYDIRERTIVEAFGPSVSFAARHGIDRSHQEQDVPN